MDSVKLNETQIKDQKAQNPNLGDFSTNFNYNQQSPTGLDLRSNYFKTQKETSKLMFFLLLIKIDSPDDQG